jgi:hypothetical protein
MDELLENIKEVQEGGKRLANWYLDHGYILLDIQSGSRAARYPAKSADGREYYVRRNPVYILGRPEGVEPAEPPPKREEEKEQGK